MEPVDLPHHFLQHEDGELVEYISTSGEIVGEEDDIVHYEEWDVEDEKFVPINPSKADLGDDNTELLVDSYVDEDEQYYGSTYDQNFEEDAEIDLNIPDHDDFGAAVVLHEDGSTFLQYKDAESRTRRVTIVECDVCGIIIKHPSKIQAHMRTHTGEKPFSCSVCGMKFTQKTPMINHYRRHIGDTPFVCGLGCGKKFVNNAQKNAHELRHQGMKRRGPPRPHLKPYRRRVAAVNRNVRRVSKSQPQQAEDHRLDEDRSAVVDWQPPYGQLEQPISAASSRRLDEVIEAVASGIPLQSRKQSTTVKASILAQCHVCGIMLKHPSKIQAHMRTHTGEKPYSCEECGMRFSTMYPLRMHIKRKHDVRQRNIACTWECGMKFVSIGARNEHERIVHAGIKRYECTVPGCRRMFTRRNYLMMHRLKEHPSYEPIFDPSEVIDDEKSFSCQPRHRPPVDEYFSVREMTLDPVTNRVVEMSSDGVLTFGDDYDQAEEGDNGVSVSARQPVFDLQQNLAYYDRTGGEETQYEIPHEHGSCHRIETLDTAERTASPSMPVQMVSEHDGSMPQKYDSKSIEETVKHVWMKNGRGSEPGRRISVRILKRNVHPVPADST